jgi:hypothetical protein
MNLRRTVTRNEPAAAEVRRGNTTATGPLPAGPGPRVGKDVTHMADERFRGASVKTLPRANRTYSTGRVCDEPGCETRLSIYNKWRYCWQHEPIHTYVPRGKRKGRRAA